MQFIEKNKWLFYIISFTWGFLASFIGMIILLFTLVIGKVKTCAGRLYGILPKAFGSGWGFSIGCFFFIAYDCYESHKEDRNIVIKLLMCHEMGHTLQNIIFGPLTLFIVTIPSVIRFWYRQGFKDPDKLKPYESIWFEGQASHFGKKYIGWKNI